MKIMSELLAEAREKHYDNSIMVKKLRAMLQSTEDNARMLKKQSTFLSQLAAKTVPKGLHCFSMRLTVEYHMLSTEEQKFEHEERLEDPNLYHYALFSDNILAAAVVVNSTVYNAKVRRRKRRAVLRRGVCFRCQGLLTLRDDRCRVDPGSCCSHVIYKFVSRSA